MRERAAEFGGGKIADGRGAVPAQLGRSFAAGQSAFGNGVAGMQVGPVRGDVEAVGFGGNESVFVGFGCGQSFCRVQVH
jgi:hypothetical protein